VSQGGPRLRLFGSRVSPFVEKVARALALKKLPFETVPVRSPLDLQRWSPQTRKMPVLEVDGERVSDSTFILRRLEALAPEPPLWSPDPRTAAAQRLLEDWADESLYWHLMALRWTDANAPATREQLAATFPPWWRPLARGLLPRALRSAVRAQGLGRLPASVLLVEFGRRLDELVQLLGPDPFLLSDADAPGGADLAVYGQLATARSGPTPELEELLSHRPALLAWCERVEARTGS